MSPRSPRPWWPLIVATALVFAVPAHADFVLVEDFDGLILGPIDDQNGWTAPGDLSEVAVDPVDENNSVLSVVTESTHLYKAVLVPSEATRMLFFRFRYENQLSCSFGMSDVSSPNRFDHFEAELSLTNSTSELRTNVDGTYVVLDVLQPEVWFNCWMMIDNGTDETQVWLHARAGEAATAADQLDAEGVTSFAFRNGTIYDLRNFFIKTGGGSGVDGPLLLDDLHVENTSALNLGYPDGSPTAVAEPPDRPGLALAHPYPNPFGRSTRIGFTVPEAGPVRLAVYDVTGRRVALLADGVRGEGTFVVDWAGTSESGTPVGAGIYFARLETRESSVARKLIVTR